MPVAPASPCGGGAAGSDGAPAGTCARMRTKAPAPPATRDNAISDPATRVIERRLVARRSTLTRTERSRSRPQLGSIFLPSAPHLRSLIPPHLLDDPLRPPYSPLGR